MATNQWLTFTVNGIIAILFGVFALVVPTETIIVLAKYFGLIVFVGGIIVLILSLSQQKKKQPYLSQMIQGIAGIIIGGAIFFFTAESLTFFMILLGIWGIIFGVLQFVIAIRLKGIAIDRNLIIINGLLTLTFGILMFFNPFEAAVAITFMVGLIALIIGVGFLYFAFRLRKIEQED